MSQNLVDSKITSNLLFDELENAISKRCNDSTKLDVVLNSYQDVLVLGKVPYLKENASTNTKTIATVSKGEYKDHIDIISETLNLDQSKITQLVEHFSLKIKNVSTNNPESSYSPSNSNVLSYFASMIIHQQALYFKILLDILKNDTEKTPIINIREKINSNGYVIIETLIENISYIHKTQQSLSSSLYSHQSFDNNASTAISNNLSCVLTNILNVFIYLILGSEKGFKDSSVEKWMVLMEETDFLSSLSFNVSEEQLATIQSLATIITLLFLDLEHNTGSIDDDASFMSDPNALLSITNHILKTKANSIILYAWSIILHRQSALLELLKEDPKSETYFKTLSGSVLQKMELVSLSFAEEAAKLDFCQSLISCNDMISYDSIFPNVLGIFVNAFVPYIEPTYEIIKTISTIIRNSSNRVIESFFANPSTEELLVLLKAKLPLQIDSFLELISINSNLAVEELRSVPTYMVSLDASSFARKYKINDQQPELITLTEDLTVPLPFETEDDVSLLMRKGFNAQLLSSDSTSSLVLFLYEYNGWSLLGRILKQLSFKISTEETEKNKLRNIIYKSLINTFRDLDKKVIDLIFESLDSFTDEVHAIDLFVKTFNQALLLRDAELSSNCLSLFQVLAEKGYTSIIWPMLYSSKLFTNEYSSGLAIDIVERVESLQGSYSFVINLLKLGNTMLDASLILNQDKDKQSLKENIINFFTNFSIQVFETFFNWKYIHEHQRYQIGSLIITFLNKICNFGIKFNSVVFNELSTIYQPSFHKVVNRFLIGVLHDPVSINPLFQCINLLSDSQMNYTSFSKTGEYYNKWTKKSLEFTSNLVRIRRVANITTPSSLEKKIYIDLPNVIKAYIHSTDCKAQILDLVTELVKGNWYEKPQSMLTHLRSTYSVILLNCLTENISDATISYELKIATFKLISAIMSSGQKGTALFLIRGKLVSSEKSDVSLGNVSLYNSLKAAVVGMGDTASGYTYHLLQTVSLSLKVWLVVYSDSYDLKFVEKLIKLINNDSKKDQNKWNVGVITKAVDILSLYLFVSQGKSKQCESKIFELLNSDAFIELLKSQFQIQNYNETLFDDVESGLKSLFGEFQLEQFQNNKEELFSYTNYVFNDKVLRAIVDQQNVSKYDALKPEIIMLDNQITFVHFQISLAKAYGGLLTCFCNLNSKNINTNYSQLASKLLEINCEENVVSELGDQIYRVRTELSFLIVLTISKLEKKPTDENVTSIIISCLKLLSSSQVNFYHYLTILDVGYYKPLLRILLISLPLLQSPKIFSEHSSLLLDIFSDNICKPISVLFNSIRNQALSIPDANVTNSSLLSKQVDDILLILSLTQQFFKLKISNEFYDEVAKILINTGAYRAIALMFTSAHLIKLNNEEVFIDYSMAFIYEFVQSKKVSETLIHNGIFHLLMESPVALIIQKTHITPYSNNSIIVRLHKLWIKRILPIVLTLTSHFGEHVIFFITQFALTFKNQFRDTLQAWLETDSLISTEIIEETEQIILLAKLLNGLDCYTYASTELGTEDVKLVPGLDSVQERKVFVNALNYLLSHPKYLSMKVRKVDDSITVAQIAEELKSMKDSLLM